MPETLAGTSLVALMKRSSVTPCGLGGKHVGRCCRDVLHGLGWDLDRSRLARARAFDLRSYLPGERGRQRRRYCVTNLFVLLAQMRTGEDERVGEALQPRGLAHCDRTVLGRVHVRTPMWVALGEDRRG